jgi:hypothetical protein
MVITTHTFTVIERQAQMTIPSPMAFEIAPTSIIKRENPNTMDETTPKLKT